MSRRRAALFALAAAALDAGALVAFHRVHEARVAIAALLTTSPNDTRFFDYEVFASEARTLGILGGVLLLSALIAALVGFAWARRRAGRGLSAVAVVAPAAMAGLTGAGLLWGMRRFFTFMPWCCWDPAMAYYARYEDTASHALPYEAARLAILAVAVISTGVVLARAGRSPALRGPRPFAPVLLFMTGLAAFTLTRAERHDAQSPMSPLVVNGHVMPRWPEAAALPPALGCDPEAPDAPMLTLWKGEWLVDGVEARDEDEAAKLLAQKRALWRQVQPNKPFPGVVEVAAPATTPLETVRPMIAATRAAGYPTVQVLEARPIAPWPSRTLGQIPYELRGCGLQMAPGRELPAARTWGEMARALAL